MIKYHYWVVEGVLDQAFLAKLLKMRGLKQVEALRRLDSFWERVIPKKFPIDGNLLKRPPIPLFMQDQEHSVALAMANGVTDLYATLNRTLKVIDHHELTSVALFGDADEDSSKTFGSIVSGLAHGAYTKSFKADKPSVVISSQPRFGIYIFPDNQGNGSLEHLLLACGEAAYPELLTSATAYVTQTNMHINKPERAEFDAPFGAEKAILASVGALLKPGKSIQVSIQDNHWLGDKSLTLPPVQGCHTFIETLLAT